MDIKLGKLFGYEMVLKDVPEEEATHVEKLATKHLENLNECYMNSMFGAVKNDIEIAKYFIKTPLT
jgi:hypothetical protein